MPSHFLCVVDHAGCFRHVNPSLIAILCYTEAYLIGKPFSKFVHPTDVKANYTIHSDMVFNAPILFFTNRMLTHSGIYKKFSWTVCEPKADGQIYAQAQHYADALRSRKTVLTSKNDST